MPAKNLLRVASKGSYSHIYSDGIDDKNIFNDNQDCEVFLSYLKEYLSEPGDPATKKTMFTVNGKTFKGTPHQPKNYLNKVELCAYRLMPNVFHLVLHQLVPESQVSFLRSLATRYSMYFNKKYNRRGSLFSGPYKSMALDDITRLKDVCRDIFVQIDKEGHTGVSATYSSYKELIGEKSTPWVKPAFVLERITPTQTKEQTLQGNMDSSVPAKRTKTLEFFSASLIIFIVLFAIGFNNVRISTASTSDSSTSIALVSSPAPSVEPQVAGVQDTKPETKLIVIIKIDDQSDSVNLRSEPSAKSEKVGQAFEGESFEFISESDDAEWYKIKLDYGSEAYVNFNYAQLLTKGENTNE